MARYYGVIGNRDHIKIDGEKRPFWEFLDHQPDGWLCSLAYARGPMNVPVGKPMIWDCGAWSYKLKDKPELPGIGLITPSSVMSAYHKLAKHGDILIAPDHMLVPFPGVDLAARRRFNDTSAIFFREVVGKNYTPMATVHGEDVDERIRVAIRYSEMGYTHLAIGGIAARASQPKLVFEIVEKVRNAVPRIHLHVLGLSSPKYAAKWQELGIQSFDGSSHFKQAFTGGKYYVFNGEKLTSFQSGRRDNDWETDAPECDCLACSRLREQGIDTRTYGSNENNMGRAAHNMNHLMRAIKCAMSV